MKQPDVIAIFNQIQAQLVAMDRKVDILMSRSLSVSQPTPKPPVSNPSSQGKPKDQHKGRMMFKAICADCKKECSIPFKPNGDRPVFCQDCFSKRKVINMSKIGVNDAPKEIPSPVPAAKVEVQKPKVKKAPVAKKSVAKKKVTAKKK